MTSQKTLRRQSLTLALADGARRTEEANERESERMKVGTTNFSAVLELFTAPKLLSYFYNERGSHLTQFVGLPTV